MGIMSGIMATALAASVGVCGVSAASGSFARVCDTVGSYARAGISRAYVDADGDGVCDNWGNRVRPLDGTGYGAHGSHGSGSGRGRSH